MTTEERLLYLENKVKQITTPVGKSILGLGCKLNDPNFHDNAKLINAALQAAFTRGYNLELVFPGGALYTYDTIVFPQRAGIRVRGNALQYTAMPEGCYWSPPLSDPAIATHWNQGGPCSRIVYMGPADKPCIYLRGAGTIIDGLTIQDGLKVVANDPVTGVPYQPFMTIRPGSVGIAIAGNEAIATSKTSFPHLSLFGWDTGIKFLLGDNPPTSFPQGDTVLFGFLLVLECKTAYRCESWQAVDHIINYGHFGAVNTIFDFENGGGLCVNAMEFMPGWNHFLSPLLLRLGEQKFNDNTAWFNINNLKVDGANPNFRLIDVDNQWDIYGMIKVRGMIAGTGSYPAADAIKVKLNAAKRLNIDVSMIYAGLEWDGRSWPPTKMRDPWEV